MAKKKDLRRGVRYVPHVNATNPYLVQIITATGERTSQYFAQAEDANAYVEKVHRERALVRAGLEMPKENILFFDYAVKFIAARKKRIDDGSDQAITYSTWIEDECRMRIYCLPKLGGMPLKSVTKEVIKDFLDELKQPGEIIDKKGNTRKRKGLSPATRNRVRALLHTMFRNAREDGYMMAGPGVTLDNPVSFIRPNSEKKKTRSTGFWDDEEHIAAYIEASYKDPIYSDHHGVFAEIQLYQGLRVCETIALQWRDVDFKRSELHVRRILERRSKRIVNRLKQEGEGGHLVVPLFPRVKEALERLRELSKFTKQTDFVLAHPKTGSYFTYEQMAGTHNRVISAANIPRITIHDMRRTFGTHAEDAGYKREDVSKMLGHGSISTTEKYLRTRPRTLLEKGAAIGFGALTATAKIIPLNQQAEGAQ